MNSYTMKSCYFVCCSDLETENQRIFEESKVDVTIFNALPMDIRTSEYSIILGELKKGSQSFTDTSFAPSNTALGEFSKSPRQIVWMRIPDVVQKACIYSLKTHPAEAIISVTSGGSQIKAALTSLALNPDKIHGIFDNQTQVNKCGIYKLRVKIKGVLQWMVIDDFIPVFADTKRPLLCGTVNHQISIMLIFKALAKICGSYSAIQGEDCFSILNILSTGPCFSYLLHPSLLQDKDTILELNDSLKTKTNSICVTTNNKPHFKLQPDYNYAVSDFRDGLVELIGLGVDGRLSHKLSFDDMLSNCVEMAFSKADRNCINSQSMELTLTCHQPFFLRFDIWEPFSLVLGFWRDRKDDEQEFMRVLVGRKMNLNKYNYVASKLQAYYEDLYVECPQMNAGTYYAMIMINGPTEKQVKVNFTHYRRLKGQMSNIEFTPCFKNSVNFEYFVRGVLLNFEESSKRQTVKELPTSGSSTQVGELYRKGGLGFITIRAGSKSSLRSLRVKVNRKEIRSSNYELLDSIKEDIEVKAGSQITLVFLLRSMPSQNTPLGQFPPGISIMELF